MEFRIRPLLERLLRRSPGEPGPGRPPRQALTVRQMLAVGGIALIVASLLSAQWLRKNAQIQNAGLTRDIGLTMARPLADISSFLRTDQARDGAQALIGRSGEDDIDTRVEFVRDTPAESEGAGGGRRARPVEPRKPVFTRDRPLRVWVIGDSLAITPGQSVLRLAEANPAMEPAGPVDGRVATGLERPDVFNWFTYVRKQLVTRRPDLVVTSFGANDDHGFMTGLPAGVSIDGFDSPSWRKEYGRRVGGVMDDLTRGGRFVAWVGPPTTRDSEQTKRFRALANVYRKEAAGRRRVLFIDTQELLARQGRGFEEYLPSANGKLVKVRSGDGVHFERPGGDRIARAVVQGVRPLVVLRTDPPRKHRAPRAAAGAPSRQTRDDRGITVP